MKSLQLWMQIERYYKFIDQITTIFENCFLSIYNKRSSSIVK